MRSLWFLSRSLRLPKLPKDRSTLYVAVIAIVGLVFVFLVPPFQSPDEQTHLYRAYELSDGHVMATHLSYGAGDLLPASLSDSFTQYDYLIFHPDRKVSQEVYETTLNIPLNTHHVKETRFENTAIYPPFAYLPQIIGITVGRLFDASPVVLLYLARLANITAWLAIIGLAMRRNRRIALPLLAFALLPIISFQAASASADVMTAGLSILFTLEIFRLVTNGVKVMKSDIFFLTGLGIALALCKFPYFLLTLLLFILPTGKFNSTSTAWRARLVVLLPAWTLAFGWLILAQRSFVNLRAGTDSAAQLHFLFTKPLSFVKVMYETYVAQSSDPIYTQAIGHLGWLDTQMPFWTLLCSAFAVILAILAMPILPEKTKQLSKIQRIITGAVLALTVLAISLSLYLTWTPPKGPIVLGLQGRYYAPLFGLLIMLGAGLLGLRSNQQRNASRIIYCLLGLSTVATIITLLLRYYQF